MKSFFDYTRNQEGDVSVTILNHKLTIQKKIVAPLLTVCACIVVLLVISAAAIAYHFTSPTTLTNQTSTNNSTQAESPKNHNSTTPPPITLYARRIDGKMVSQSDANLVPQCVMIENAAFGGVRPQSGLSRASVVYEVIVEGGITRLMAVFAGDSSEQVGPVRSARDTYLEFASELNCAYFHAGGSDTALGALYHQGMRHVDGLIESRYFWRESTRIAPHNLFTSTDNLREATRNHNWTNEEAPTYTPWTFVPAIPEIARATAESDMGVHRVSIEFGGSYDVAYEYNAAENAFERYNGGELQTDAVNGETIRVKNVIVMHVGSGIPIEGKGRINWPVTGSGDVDIFHDGQIYRGRWTKEDRTSRTLFTDMSGNTIPLVEGNSWVEIVPPSIPFEYE